MSKIEVEPGQIWQYRKLSKWVIVERVGIQSSRYKIFCIEGPEGDTRVTEYNFDNCYSPNNWTRLA